MEQYLVAQLFENHNSTYIKMNTHFVLLLIDDRGIV
jgi:hypothetical protein